MTSYSSFIQDFPKRCKKLLSTYEEDARENDLEVTLLLAVATSAFTIPFERLNPSSSNHVADDRYTKAVRKLGKLQNKNFVSWQIGSTWRIIDDLDGQQIRTSQLDAWASPDKRRLIPADKKTGSILSVLRNALAHGSIFIYPNTRSQSRISSIEHILFLSRLGLTEDLNDRFNVLVTSPSDFRKLILDWVSFLENIKLPNALM